MDNLWTAKEVADELGCTVSTINFWYRFKREHPDNEFVKELPEFIRLNGGERGVRYWKKDDIVGLKLFQKLIPHGRNGILGSVTQKYQR